MIFNELPDDGVLTSMGQSSGPRTRGVLHLSDIYKSINQELDPKRFSDDGGPNLEKMEVGLLFESILEEALARKYATVRPGEVKEEGVWMSPDGVNLTDEALEEYKATWMSSRHGLVDVFGMPLQKFQHWFWQIQAYCRALGVQKAILTVLWVNGDYVHPYQPTLKRYAMTFTIEELNENWSFLIRHAREKGMLQ